MTPTIVRRLPLADTLPLDQRIADLCDVNYAAGYALVGCFEVGAHLVLIFQQPLKTT
jgi:hypothetical protein